MCVSRRTSRFDSSSTLTRFSERQSSLHQMQVGPEIPKSLSPSQKAGRVLQRKGSRHKGSEFLFCRGSIIQLPFLHSSQVVRSRDGHQLNYDTRFERTRPVHWLRTKVQVIICFMIHQCTPTVLRGLFSLYYECVPHQTIVCSSQLTPFIPQWQHGAKVKSGGKP